VSERDILFISLEVVSVVIIDWPNFDRDFFAAIGRSSDARDTDCLAFANGGSLVLVLPS
jgi:hypothetical protein